MNDLFQMVMETVAQHIPHQVVWVPALGTGTLALIGLLFIWKGARLAPGIAALAFMGIGAGCGAFLAQAVAAPYWPTVIVGGVLGFGLGLGLFKLWLGLLVAACFAGGALTIYGARVVTPHLENYSSRGLDVEHGVLGVTVPEPDSEIAAAPSLEAEFGQLWDYLVEVVPNFQASFWAIVLSTGLAGLLLGLLMPRPARALVAATAGTLFLFVATVGLLETLWPEALVKLKALGGWGWLIVAAFWLTALLLNLADMMRPTRKMRHADVPEAEGKPAPA